MRFAAPHKPYPFLRDCDALRSGWRLAYPFLRTPSQKRVRATQSRAPYLLKTQAMTRRTCFCGDPQSQPYPFLRRNASSRANEANSFLRERVGQGVPISAGKGDLPPREARTCFCVSSRRNRFARRADTRGKPLANKAFYPQKQVRPREVVLTRRAHLQAVYPKFQR